MKTEKHFIFEHENSWGITIYEHFVTPIGYINEKLKFSNLTLLHFHFDENKKDCDYYLFFGDKGLKDSLRFSFQFNKGDELVELLKNNDANYYRYDIIETLDSRSSYHLFKLKGDQVIKYQTYANGTTSGTQIYDINTEGKDLLHLPLAELDLDSRNKAVILKWTGEKIPDEYKEIMAEEAKDIRKGGYLVLIILIIVLILYYFIF